jgi:hypothetical protein
MMNYRKIVLIFLLVVAHGLLISQAQLSKKVLFVGNSYTYFWNLPQCVSAMTQTDSLQLITRQSTNGGVNLSQHWHSKKDLETRAILEQDNFDIVVLQDHSMRAINSPDSLQFYGHKFADLISHKGAKVFLYMTWAREWNPYMQKTITEQYGLLAESINATIVPVGPAWQKAKEMRSDIDLYDPDGSHPSPTGTYLTACVFYGVLTGQSPVGLPARLISQDHNGEKLYLNIQSEGDALFLQEVANDIIKEWNP